MSEAGGKIAIPMGLAMRIAENPDALRAFGQMSEETRAVFINRAKGAKSPEEMRAIASEIATFR